MKRIFRGVRRARWLPKGSTVILCVIGLGLVAAVGVHYANWTESDDTLLGAIGALSALGFFVIQNALEHARFQRELFLQFNERYDEHNDKLISLLDQLKKEPAADEPPQWSTTLEDYFNLCGEEYYYFRKGYVDREVWDNWLAGMYWWYSQHERIGSYWNKKLAEDSYYGLSRAIILEGRAPNQARVAWASGSPSV